MEISAEPEHGEDAATPIDHAFATITKVHYLMSYHDPASDVSRLNRAAARGPVIVHPWTRFVLEAARRIHRATKGLFDCSIAPTLVGDKGLPDFGFQHAPDASLEDMEIAGCQVTFRKPLTLDLGGIAKGFAVDRAVAALRQAGIRSGAVNAGGDLRVFGRADQTIRVRVPNDCSRLVTLGTFRAAACATSAATFTRRIEGGREVCDLVDPRTRLAIQTGRSFTVLARTCLVADALTKVLAISDGDEGLLAPFRARAFVL